MRALALALIASLAACTGASNEFLPAIDGGPDAPTDAPDNGDGPNSFFIVVSSSDVSVVEGQVTSFNVSLSAAPSEPVTVMIQSGDALRVETTTQITFTNDNFSVETPVSVTALGDADAAPNNVNITVSAPGAQDEVIVTAHVTDDDTLSIFADPTSIQVTEGFQGTVKVTLTAAPTEDVIVSTELLPTLPGVASVSPATLTFTAATWDDEQDVIITAEQDLDVQSATSMLRLSSGQVMDPATVAVTIVDDDEVQIQPMPSTLGTIVEEGAPTALDIRLTQQPSGPVRVTITPEIAGKVSVVPGFVDFDPQTWNVNQTVQVTAVHDDDTRDDTLDLVLTGPAPLVTRRVSVTVDDNDIPTLQVSAMSVTVLEGNTVQLGVRLAFDPLGPVTVTANIDNPTISTITVPAGGMLTFDSSDYDTYKTITIRGEQDQDLAVDSTFVTFQAVSLNTSRDVTINKTDDDVQVIETDMTTVSLTETGQATFGVRLRFRPTIGTAVSVSTGANPHASVAPTSIPFNLGDYNDYKTVTVTGTHDVDLVPDTVPVTLSGASAPANATVTATVTDVDMQTIVLSSNNVTVTEGGTSTFTVSLSHMPAANVSVTIASMNGLVATATPTPITFMPGNYSTPVQVTVSGTQDADALPGSTSIVASIPGAMPPVASQNVAVTVNDDDSQILITSVTSTSLTEGMMASMTLGVRLQQDPLGNVTVNAESLDPAVVALVGTTSFVFNSSDYMNFKYVTLNAIQDDDLQVQSATIRFSSLSPALMTTATVSKPDDDLQAINTSVGSVTLLEGGTAQFGVRLAFQPPGNVTVQVASADANKATTSGNLTFGPGDWNMFQNVTVTGTHDDNLAAESVNITMSSPGNVMTPRVVGATVNDDDQQAILGVPANISLLEGAQSQFNVRLMYQPATSSVTVSLSTNPTGVVSTSANLTFTNSNWQTNQQVTITGTQDVDLVSENTTLTVSGAAAPASVTSSIAVTDDDTLTIVRTPANVTVNENSTGSFSVSLSHQPMNPVTVTLSVSPAGVANLSTLSIPFTTSNWMTPVSVTVTPVQDVDNQSESTTVTLSSGVTSMETVGITVNDTTVVNQPGWPTYFGAATNAGSPMARWAYRVQTGSGGTWTLDNIGMITSTAGNMTKMAIYTHDSVMDKPDILVATTTATAVVAGTNTFTPTAATLMPNTTYWIAFTVSAAIPIGDGGPGPIPPQARRCTRAALSFGDAFPGTWGSLSCITANAINIFATSHL